MAVPDEPAAALAQPTPPTRARLRRPSLVAISALQHLDGTVVRFSSSSLESLNYDEAENESLRAKMVRAPLRTAPNLFWTCDRPCACGPRAVQALPKAALRRLHHSEPVMAWLAVVVTGFLVGSVAHASARATSELSRWKFDLIRSALERDSALDGWLILSSFALTLAACAALLTCWAPEAGGSGIPLVKAFLNGNRLDGALRPRTLVAKVGGPRQRLAPRGRARVRVRRMRSCVMPPCPAGRSLPLGDLSRVRAPRPRRR